VVAETLGATTMIATTITILTHMIVTVGDRVVMGVMAGDRLRLRRRLRCRKVLRQQFPTQTPKKSRSRPINAAIKLPTP